MAELVRSSSRRGSIRYWRGVLPLLAACAACGPAPVPQAPLDERSAVPLTTVDGQVLGVDRASPAQALNQSLRLTIRPGARGLVVVELAPGWYLEEQGLVFSPDDRVVVEGRVRGSNGIVVARRVTKGDKSVELRDARGQPVWNPHSPRPQSE